MTGDGEFLAGEPRSPEEARARLLASRELGKIWRALKAMRVFLWSIAVFTALLAVILHLVWLDARPAARGFPWATLVASLTALTMATAALRLHREPLLWGSMATVFQTITALLLLLTASLVVKVFAIVLAMGCYAATITIGPLSKKVRRYPDLRIARKIRGRDRRRAT